MGRWASGVRGGAALLLTAGLVAACGGGPAQPAAGGGDTYRVLLLAPLSGALATSGQTAKAAVQAAADAVNANGGVAGKRIELTIQDDKGDPTEVANLVNAAVSAEHPPDYIQPGLTSTEAVAAQPITSAAGVLAGSSAAAATLQRADRAPLFLGASPLGSDAARALVTKLKAAGITSMGLVVGDVESTVAEIAPYQEAAQAAGIRFTGVEKVPGDAIDVSPQLQRLRAGNPEALVMAAFGPPIAPIMHARATLGWTVPVWGDGNVTASPLGQLLSPAELADLTLVPPLYGVQGSPATATPAFATEMAALQRYTGGKLTQPFQIYNNSYSGLVVVKYAADLAGTTEAKAVYDARTRLRAAAMPLYLGSSGLYKDPASNFMTFEPGDFAVVKGAPLDNGLIVPTAA
jgi:branched-chain amino acid transport system substrate-binding protein